MADPTYILQDDPEYDEAIRALQNSDPANADTVFNPLIEKTLNNIHYVKLAGDKLAEQVAEIAEETGAGAISAVNAHNTSDTAHQDLRADIAATQQAVENAQASGVPITRKINGKELSADITLTAADVGARPDTWEPSPGGGAGVRTATIVVGTTQSGHQSGEVDVLCDGTRDAEQINEALGLLPETGGLLFIREGTYIINQQINVSKGYVTIQGTKATMLKRGTAESAVGINLLRITGIYCCLESLSLVGNASSTSNISVTVAGGGSVIRNCDISAEGGSGVVVTARQCSIMNNKISGNVDCGIIVSSYDSLISGNYLINNGTGVKLVTEAGTNTVSFNHCKRADGYSTDYTSTQYTILIDSKATKNFVFGNVLFGKNFINNGGDTNMIEGNFYTYTTSKGMS